MLIKYDDLPLQQTTESLAYLATSDRDAYGRYWFNGFSPDGEYYFGIAFAMYPNREVMDCALSIVRKDGTQDSFRASRRCPLDRSEMVVGPFKLEIVELMRVIRVTIADNETGVTADLTFTGSTPVHEEPTDFVRPKIRMTMQMKRYTQFGRWSGYIDVKGRRQEVDNVYGIRDRSWGWRMCGEPPGGAYTMIPSQAFYLWAPIIWPDMCTHYGTWENAQGRSQKDFAQIFPVYDIREPFDTLDPSGFREIKAGRHRLRFDDPKSRFVSGGEIDLIDGDQTLTIKLEALLRFHMYGIGYNHPTWAHGMWKGEEAITSEHWNLADIDPTATQYQHTQVVVRARIGDEVGHGVLEQAIFGDHDQYGFKGFTTPLGASGG
ncbi:MAG TPA: hypothetical protein VJS38_18980 [Phenylobacterium sp.]|uniref:hypothetical protein n=1 Tax=Phenylobacterium sp. TaxID=1871053 RepID=UPI002B47F44C|nr:hypothetical protein [Phenylobacterium sp.]HKQ94328.1 hypothetical protein [Aestuariivirgaceae bacterium]HKR90258.1 hypothetical protein [Phenylobacterium sp.]